MCHKSLTLIQFSDAVENTTCADLKCHGHVEDLPHPNDCHQYCYCTKTSKKAVAKPCGHRLPTKYSEDSPCYCKMDLEDFDY